MKKIIRTIALCIAAAAFTACSDDQRGDVISQDTSYEVDQDYVFVDIPPVFDFDPSNIVYMHGKTILHINGKHDSESGHTSIQEGNTFQFQIKLKKAMEEDVIVRLKQDASLLEEHANPEQLLDFPQEAYTLAQVALPKGTKEAVATLEISQADLLNETPGYLLPLRLEIVDAASGLLVSSMHYSVFVHLSIIIGKDNIEPSNEPIDGIEFNDIMELESDDTYGLKYLKDGKTGGWDYWSPDEASNYLIMSLPEPETLKGFELVTTNTRWAVGRFNVYVDEGKGFVAYGEVKRNTKGAPFYVKFKKPVQVKAIKLDGFLSTSDREGPELYEVYFIR